MVRVKKLNIRLSPEERQTLEILAAREGRNLSELARELLRSAIEARGQVFLNIVGLDKVPKTLEAN